MQTCAYFYLFFFHIDLYKVSSGFVTLRLISLDPTRKGLRSTLEALGIHTIQTMMNIDMTFRLIGLY